jgi:hypothetical protein
MRTDDDTPATENESTELTGEWPPLDGEADSEVAAVLVEKKNETREVVNRLDRALQNDGVELADEDVEALLGVGNDLRGLAANLAHRVPEGERAGAVDGDVEG